MISRTSFLNCCTRERISQTLAPHQRQLWPLGISSFPNTQNASHQTWANVWAADCNKYQKHSIVAVPLCENLSQKMMVNEIFGQWNLNGLPDQLKSSLSLLHESQFKGNIFLPWVLLWLPAWVSPVGTAPPHPEGRSGSEGWCAPGRWSTEVKMWHSETDKKLLWYTQTSKCCFYKLLRSNSKNVHLLAWIPGRGSRIWAHSVLSRQHNPWKPLFHSTEDVKPTSKFSLTSCIIFSFVSSAERKTKCSTGHQIHVQGLHNKTFSSCTKGFQILSVLLSAPRFLVQRN